MIWSAASRARRDLKDNGKGQTFPRHSFPVRFFLIVIAAFQAHEAHGILCSARPDSRCIPGWSPAASSAQRPG